MGGREEKQSEDKKAVLISIVVSNNRIVEETFELNTKEQRAMAGVTRKLSPW